MTTSRRGFLARCAAAVAALALPWRKAEATPSPFVREDIPADHAHRYYHRPWSGGLPKRVIVRATGGEVLYDGKGPVPPLPSTHRQFYIEQYWWQ